ncbi:class I SAM-dependent methyltransferase [Kribbella turkmenica]|uniref:Class I SAM-dependent methyltransferase n=1 Tax=Kribbella turkmenica TaxID=2530375 RepID=A0A4R4WVJ5_9ACTN|nr:class I SAM-dependent methyltransferase [Kribbella turkmenica]TDD21769.1 class I SAM-dependent methyltransferase [Kribbella turkmenica]
MFDYDAELRRYHRRLLPAMNVRPADQVLDIGCGTGLTTRAAAEEALSALGVDISAEMVATARKLSEHLPNVSFEQADVQHHQFPPEQFSLAVSRFGTMFFTDPVAAFTNIARALRPGARLVQLVWQDETHQEWYVEIRRTLADTPATAGHAAFSLADPATTERILADAGFTDVQLLDVREPVYYGADVEAALDNLRSLQMAQGSDRDIDRLRAMLETHLSADGVWFDSRAWIVMAHRR